MRFDPSVSGYQREEKYEGRRHDGFKGKRWEGKGKMPEWLKGLVLKTRDRKGSVGSNPILPKKAKKEKKGRKER